jgi:hypothetical protein
MEPISWLQIAALALKYGVPFVDKLISNAQNNTPVTPEAWDDLKKTIPFDTLVPKRVTP